jgi:hypothetical protein
MDVDQNLEFMTKSCAGLRKVIGRYLDLVISNDYSKWKPEALAINWIGAPEWGKEFYIRDTI